MLVTYRLQLSKRKWLFWGGMSRVPNKTQEYMEKEAQREEGRDKEMFKVNNVKDNSNGKIE